MVPVLSSLAVESSPSTKKISDPESNKESKSTFIKLRELDKESNWDEILKLLSKDAIIVLIDKNQKELKLTKSQLKEVSKYLNKNDKTLIDNSLESDVITYTSLKFEEPQDQSKGAIPLIITGIRDNKITKTSAPFYLEIANGVILHYAWEPVRELDLQNALNNPEVAPLLTGFNFGSDEEIPLPPIPAKGSVEGGEQGQPNPNSPPSVSQEKEAKVSAVRVLSQDPLETIGKKFVSMIEKKHPDSSIQLIESFIPMVSGTTIDPRNTLHANLLKSNAAIEQEPPITEILGVRLIRANSQSEEVIILYQSLKVPLIEETNPYQTPQRGTGAVRGEDIKLISDKIYSNINEIDPLSLNF
jgi:hypothetical protein